jgi:hypothetical protein
MSPGGRDEDVDSLARVEAGDPPALNGSTVVNFNADRNVGLAFVVVGLAGKSALGEKRSNH